MPLQIDNLGLFLGLISLPVGCEREFYENEFEIDKSDLKGLFAQYKASVRSNFRSNTAENWRDEFDKYLYKPSAYYLFGHFDMGILSLIDDFEFPCRRFHPFDPTIPNKKNRYFENFKYQIISGYFPRLNKKSDKGLLGTAKETFLASSKSKLPLIGICCFKLNNSLLIGAGIEFLKNVLYFLREYSQEFLKRKNDQRTKIMVTLSYSWHELVFIVFSDSYKKISDLILTIREKNLGDLNEFKDSIPGFYTSNDVIKNQSINACIINREQDKILKIEKTHLFENSTSIFGFDFEIFKQIDDANKDKTSPGLLDQVTSDQNPIKLFTRWFTKPGHLAEALKVVQGIEDPEDISVCIGRGDFIYSSFYGKDTINTRDYIKGIVQAALEPDIRKHIMQSYSIMEVPSRVKELMLPEVGCDHFYFLEHLHSLKVSVVELKKIMEKLRAFGVPKILKAKILNIFSNFNDGILDTVLYGYFSELLDLMAALTSIITDDSNPTAKYGIKTLNKTLECYTVNFEKAYRNRFHQSYRMSEITDFTIEYKGGIHQLVTCFDSAFKAVCNGLGSFHSFAYVSGTPGVFTTPVSICLNYFHIFQPEIFVAIATHEAANFLSFNKFETEVETFEKLKKIYQNSKMDKKSLEQTFDQLLALDKKEEILKNFATLDYFRNVLVDLISFYFTYNQDVELFSYWYWNVFMQMPDAYKEPGNIDQLDFLGFLLRFLGVLKISGKSKEFDLAPSPNQKIEKTWEKWIGCCSGFLDKLLGLPHVDAIVTEMRILLESIVDKAYGNFIKGTETFDEKIEKVADEISHVAKKIKDALKDGEVFAFDPGNLDSFQFTQAVFNGYLNLIRESGGGGKRNPVLNRDQDGVPKIKKNKDADFLFDPTGGIFTHDPLTRRNYFQYRAALTMTLWDMGMREKKNRLIQKMTAGLPC
jgi:hypothetical protein